MKMSWQMYVAMLVLGNLFLTGLGIASSMNRVIEANERQMNTPTEWKYRMPHKPEFLAASPAQPLPAPDRK